MRNQITFLIIVSMLAATAFAATYPTYINITISETVHQNITFAKDFDLIESVEECRIIGMINITNPSAETVGDVYVNFTNTDQMQTNFTHLSGRTGSQIGNKTPGSTWRLHIPELRPGNESTWQYNLSCTTTPSPLNITTSYDSGVGGLQKKVLAGKNFSVSKWVSNEFSSANLTDVSILMETQAVAWNTTEFNFTFINLSYVGDSDRGNVTITDNQTWTWDVAGGLIEPNDEYNITYYVQAPDNVPTSNTYLFLKETSTYRIIALLSNLTVTSVRGNADLDIDLQKQITRPAHDVNDTNVTWQGDGNVTVPFDIAYSVKKVSMWVTHNLSPLATDTDFGLLNKTYPSTTVNSTIPWDTTADPYTFNFTDGSADDSPPPILWMRPYYYIFEGGNQILVYNVTQNGTDTYLSYIYVVNGYWLEVDKNITSQSESSYRIDVRVENIGNAYTPEGLAVTVYDFVPAEFESGGYVPATHAPDSNATVEGEGFNGTSYRWVIPNKPPYNASLGPGDFWNTTYYVNGTGDYKISELYIVGLDPRKVDGAGTHEGITVITNLSSYTKEVFYVVGVLALLILNVVNFVMTRRINSKLNK